MPFLFCFFIKYTSLTFPSSSSTHGCSIPGLENILPIVHQKSPSKCKNIQTNFLALHCIGYLAVTKRTITEIDSLFHFVRKFNMSNANSVIWPGDKTEDCRLRKCSFVDARIAQHLISPPNCSGSKYTQLFRHLHWPFLYHGGLVEICPFSRPLVQDCTV